MSDINQNSGTSTPLSGEPSFNGMAIASLVLGITSIACCSCALGFLGVIALILGIMAMKKIKEDPTAFKGQGMALAGIITGSVGIFVFIIQVIYIIVAIATDNVDSLKNFNGLLNR